MIKKQNNEVLQLLQDLISIESHIEAPGREEAIGKYLVDWFRARDIHAKRQLVEGHRGNVVARIPGRQGPSLMFNGHLDTVPAGDMESAFVPRIEGNELWGRGACDMKGAIAAMAVAMVEIKHAMDAGQQILHGELLFTGTVGEETGSIGVKALVDGGIKADYAVVGEPTNLQVGIAHKGACFIRIELVGRGAHGSRPEEGVNAVSHAARLIHVLETEFRTRLQNRSHELLGASTVSVGRICGGTQPNIVAEHCFVDIDRRTLPNEGDPLAEVQELAAQVLGSVPELSFNVVEMEETSVVPHVALGTAADTRLAQSAALVCRELNLPNALVGVTYWTDGGHLAANGVETIILGPGDIANAHGPRDRVQVDELDLAKQFYFKMATDLLC